MVHSILQGLQLLLGIGCADHVDIGDHTVVQVLPDAKQAAPLIDADPHADGVVLMEVAFAGLIFKINLLAVGRREVAENRLDADLLREDEGQLLPVCAVIVQLTAVDSLTGKLPAV